MTPRLQIPVALLGLLIAFPLPGHGEDRIRTAAEKSLRLLERGARGSLEERARCFTCHNQALPVFALTLARRRGLAVDEDLLATQVRFTAGFLARNRERYRQGQGQGGQALTAGYALWTLDQAGWTPDETTAAVADYLLVWQEDRVHWDVQTRRPPSEESLFAVTHFAALGLQRFGIPEQKEPIDRRLDQVSAWLSATPARGTEDQVFRLWALHTLGAAEDEREAAARELLDARRPDGGWAQLEGMESDAYATGSALVALHEAGGIEPGHEAYRAGVEWLLARQMDDGSWHVRSRSKPIQEYYESGYPHGTDQFISITAAGWATAALLEALPERPGP